MPTGYTYQIKEGITFEKFTLSCARAFGALITMRDEPNDAPIPNEINPSDYHLKALKRAKFMLKKYEGMSLANAKILAKSQYDEEVDRINKCNKEDKELEVKYRLMLDKVKSWVPPTPEHKGLKDFMIEQIESSIKHDCGRDREYPKMATAEQWLFERKESMLKEIKYHQKAHKEEVDRCAERTKWIQELMKSIK